MSKIFVCITCDKHGNPNWPPRKTVTGSVTITGEEWEQMRYLLLEAEPKKPSTKHEAWVNLWQLAHGWLRRMEAQCPPS